MKKLNLENSSDRADLCGINILYNFADNNKEELFWETLQEPYRSLLEECYCLAEDGKFLNLADITQSIKFNRLSYIKLGVQLYQVKFYQLYRGAYKSFKHYCEEAIHYPIWRANQVMEAARVAIQLIKFGFKIIPQNEAQARPLSKLNLEQLIEKWQQVLDLYSPAKITALKIEKVVWGDRQKRKGSIKLPIKLLEKIECKALENGMSVEELITKMIEGELTVNEGGNIEIPITEERYQVQNISSEAFKKWEKDLEQLAFQERNKIDEFAEELAEKVMNTVTDFKVVIKQCFIKSFLQPFCSPHAN